MASNEHKLTLTNIPLEVRHHIFKFVAMRNSQPRKLLRYWFEKKEVKEKTAELAARNLNAKAPQVVYEGDQFDHEEHEEHNSEDNQEEGVGDEGGDQDSEQDADEDEQEEAGEDEGESGEYADLEGTDSTFTDLGNTLEIITSSVPVSQPLAQGQHDPATTAQVIASAAADQSLTDKDDASAATSGPPASVQISAAAVSASTLAPAQMHSQDGTEDEGADAAMDEDDGDQHGAQFGAAQEEDVEMGEENENDEVGYINADSDDGMAEEDGNTGTETGVAQRPSPVPVITAHRKWRHIPQFMRITHSPPPVELLLSSKRLNAEAKSWFYDVAVLCIDATGSFAHTSFFEEAFSQIIETAFSPIVDIRKVDVTFVWDTTWLRSEQAECAAAIFPALLRQRALFVTSILALAPSLSEVTIHWHDTAQDDEAMDLMNDVLMGFLGLDADVKVEPHFVAAEMMPYRKSIAGKQRVEFQRILHNGLDRLF